MTYNIKAGRYHPDGLEALARVIEAQSPDVLGLQEVDEGMARSNRVAQTDWLTRRLRMGGLYAPAIAHADGGLYGIALLSRLPIRSHERRLLYRPAYPDAVRHPHHDSEQRVMLGAKLEGGPNVVVTHLGLTTDQRATQVQQLADFAREWGGVQPTLLLGDFNCDPDAVELAPLRTQFQDACEVCAVRGDARFTFPSGSLGARTADGWRGAIDHVWATQGIRIVSARVVMDDSRASDHQPVCVECEIEAN